MNQVFLLGNVVQKPELKYTKNNIPFCNLILSVKKTNHKCKNAFFDIEYWDKLAENINKYADKGTKVLINGMTEKIGYEIDGKVVYKVKIVGNSIEFLNLLKKENMNGEVLC